MPCARQYDWKCRICVKTPKWLNRQRSKARTIPKLSRRKLPDATSKLCSSKPSACLKPWRVLLAWKCPHLKRHVPFLTGFHYCAAGVAMGLLQNLSPAPKLPLHCVDSGSREVASGCRTSHPTRPISMLTSTVRPTCATVSRRQMLCANAQPCRLASLGSTQGSREATMTKTEPARAHGSTVAQRFDRFRSGGTECSGNRCETCRMFPEMRDHKGAVSNRRKSAVRPCHNIQNRFEVTCEDSSRPSNSVPSALPNPTRSSVL